MPGAHIKFALVQEENYRYHEDIFSIIPGLCTQFIDDKLRIHSSSILKVAFLPQ